MASSGQSDTVAKGFKEGWPSWQLNWSHGQSLEDLLSLQELLRVGGEPSYREQWLH